MHYILLSQNRRLSSSLHYKHTLMNQQHSRRSCFRMVHKEPSQQCSCNFYRTNSYPDTEPSLQDKEMELVLVELTQQCYSEHNQFVLIVYLQSFPLDTVDRAELLMGYSSQRHIHCKMLILCLMSLFQCYTYYTQKMPIHCEMNILWHIYRTRQL